MPRVFSSVVFSPLVETSALLHPSRERADPFAKD